MQKTILFIVPHFGKFNNYFQLWLHSCNYNPSIDWLIFTDDHTPYNYPANVKVVYTTFSAMRSKIQEKFDFEIVLNNPYQLCEFKIAYGEIFSDYVKDYDFWGHCDTDVIWGNLRKHINDQILKLYTKISWRGHLTLYKNEQRINHLYRTPINGIEFYKYAFANNTGYPLAPDERLINAIFHSYKEPVYTQLLFADLKIRSFNFSLLHFSSKFDFKNHHQIFLWDAGELQRVYVHKDKVYVESFAYIHFLKRKMKADLNFKLGDKFLIAPNKFINCDTRPNINEIKHLSKEKYYWDYLLSRCTLSYLVGKISYFKSKHLFRRRYPFLLSPKFSTFPALQNDLNN